MALKEPVAQTGALSTTSITSLHGQAMTTMPGGGLKSSSMLLSTAKQSQTTGSASTPDGVTIVTYNFHICEALCQSVCSVWSSHTSNSDVCNF